MEQSNSQLISIIKKTVQALEGFYGIPKRPEFKGKLLYALIHIILSQSTSDLNSGLAYKKLREKFPTIEELATAKKEDIARSIQSAGLYRQKSERITAVLRWAREHFGSLNIDEICGWPVEKVMEVFTAQKGIGVKTMAVLLNFECGKDIFPVDTHVHRIARRLHFVPQNYSAERTFFALDPLIPAGKSYSCHVNLLKLGRTICKARETLCDDCPLKHFCPSAPNARKSKKF